MRTCGTHVFCVTRPCDSGRSREGGGSGCCHRTGGGGLPWEGGGAALSLNPLLCLSPQGHWVPVKNQLARNQRFRFCSLRSSASEMGGVGAVEGFLSEGNLTGSMHIENFHAIDGRVRVCVCVCVCVITVEGGGGVDRAPAVCVLDPSLQCVFWTRPCSVCSGPAPAVCVLDPPLQCVFWTHPCSVNSGPAPAVCVLDPSLQCVFWTPPLQCVFWTRPCSTQHGVFSRRSSGCRPRWRTRRWCRRTRSSMSQ